MKPSPPLLSVLMLTYNHAPFVQQALDSCLAQQTSFSYEIIVCDDSSTDGTRDILLGYAEKHPEIVLSLQPTNSKISKNFIDGMGKVRGRYVAFCEGDDYWKAPYKLEKQVRFLEDNPDFSVCCHKVEMFFEGLSPAAQKQFVYKDCSVKEQRIRDGIFYADEAIANYFFQTGSMVFRWLFTGGLPVWFTQHMLFDHFLFMLHAVEGKIKYFDEDMSVWRRHGGGYSWMQTLNKGLFFQKEGADWLLLYQNMDRFFCGRFTLQIRERILLALRGIVDNCLKTNQIEQLRSVLLRFEEYFEKPVIENKSLLDAVRLAFPEAREYYPPWACTTPSEAVPAVDPSSQTAGAAPQPSMGGYFELGLSSVPEVPDSVWSYWVGDGEAACFANSAQALFTYIWHCNVTTIWLPVHFSSTLENLGVTLHIRCKWYACGRNVEPSAAFLDMVQPGEAVLTSCFFGRPVAEDLQQALLKRPDIVWIEDRRQALWPGAASKAHAALYCPPQVLGAPDGAIVTGKGVAALQPEDSETNRQLQAEFIGAAFTRFESPHIENSHIVRHSLLESTQHLPKGSCSRTTLELLRRIPLPHIVAGNKNNWEYLALHLAPYALWPLRQPSFAPSGFPVLVPESIPVELISTILAARGIFCQRFCYPLKVIFHTYPAEERLAKSILVLPCDHRYAENAMARLVAELAPLLRGDIAPETVKKL